MRKVLLWGVIGVCLFSGEASALRMEKPQPFSRWDCPSFTRLNNTLSDFWNITNGRYAVDTIANDPSGSRIGDRGELVQASFGGSRYFCVNMSTPSPGTDWRCVGIGVGTTLGANPTTGIFCGGTLSTAMNCENFRGRIPVACTPNRVDLTVTTAPTGAAIIVDVNECSNPTTCTTLFTTQANRPQIAASATSGNSTTFDDTSIALGNYIGFDIDQVGSGTAGGSLTVTLVCQ